MTKGDTLDFVVGMGNGFYGADTTALAACIRAGNEVVADAARDFSVKPDSDGPGRGNMAHSPRVPHPMARPSRAIPSARRAATTTSSGRCPIPVRRSGSVCWLTSILTSACLTPPRSFVSCARPAGARLPLFVSEYGVGSGVDLWRVTRHYERLGKQDVEDAQFYRDKLDRFLADWDRWKMNECFTRPEDFFAQSIRQMAAERLYGLNALRANPGLVAHSVTGTVDQGMSGEGLFTTFRELKPGTTDAMFEAWAPLRLCLFADPLHVYRGAPVKLEAVLANEDALPPGEYPVRLSVMGPDMRHVFQRVVTVAIPGPGRRRGSPVCRDDLRGRRRAGCALTARTASWRPWNEAGRRSAARRCSMWRIPRRCLRFRARSCCGVTTRNCRSGSTLTVSRRGRLPWKRRPCAS